MDKNNSKELIQRINSKEFREFFKNNIEVSLNKFEFMRQIILSIAYSLFVISLSIKYLSYTGILENTLKLNAIFALLFLLAFIPFCYNERYKSIAKNIFLKKMLNFIGDFSAQNKTRQSSSKDEFNETGLFKYYRNIDCNTLISGRFGDKKFEVQDVSLSNHRLFANEFGLVVEFFLNKSVNSHILITQDAVILNKKLKDLKPINLEDNPKLNNIFHIFSDNSDRVKEFVTDDVVDKLIKLHIKTNKQISCVFKNKKMYLFIDDYNPFDMPFFKSINNVKDYQDMLSDFVEILSVSDVIEEVESVCAR